MLILLYIAIIILKALADALNDNGHKGFGHAFTSLWVAGLIVSQNFIDLPAWYVQLISFTLLMIALFDYAYNLARILPISYIGTTPWWDKVIAKVPFGFMLFVRVICLIVGVFILLNGEI